MVVSRRLFLGPPRPCCAMKYKVFYLQLPSGGVVLVRKLTRLAMLANGLLCFPLLSTAVEASSAEEERVKTGIAKHVMDLCRAALVDEELSPHDLTLSDRMAVYQWASTPEVIDPAQEAGEREWGVAQFKNLVASQAAVTTDLLARRYMARPSELMGLEDADLAMDLDLAIAYRGIMAESKTARGEQEIEVEDIFGRTHKVPANWFEGADPGAKITHAEDYGKRAQRLGLKEMALSAGGAFGATAGDAFGRMNRFRQ